MTREEYVKYRATNTYPASIMYAFLKENTPKGHGWNSLRAMNEQEFNAHFSVFLAHGADFNTILIDVRDWWDRKFNISILRNKNQEIIKVY